MGEWEMGEKRENRRWGRGAPPSSTLRLCILLFLMPADLLEKGLHRLCGKQPFTHSQIVPYSQSTGRPETSHFGRTHMLQQNGRGLLHHFLFTGCSLCSSPPSS